MNEDRIIGNWKQFKGKIREQWGRLTDDEVIAELVQVKGIGHWTAQMCLMFSLGRLDVFPHDDLGIPDMVMMLTGPVVLFFYNRDFSPACTAQAKRFRDMKAEWAACGAHVVGVSPDDAESHQAFVKQMVMGFPLVPDPERRIFKLFGIRSFLGIKRRLEVVGTARGVTVFDDFAHHPTAVRETLLALRAGYPQWRIWAIFEPRSASSCRRAPENSQPPSGSARWQKAPCRKRRAHGLTRVPRLR